MYEAVYMAATGLTQQQLRLDTIANNVANVNTVGYKATRLDFKDALYTANSLGPLASPEENHQKGHGVMSAANNRLFFTGAQVATERELDFAIVGPGYFEMESATGERLYTKGGNLYISDVSTDGRQYLVDSAGRFVHDMDGNRIAFPEGSTDVSCDENGVITFTGLEQAEAVQMGLFSFANQAALEAVGDSSFRVSVASGPARPDGEVKLRQGALEASNVSLSDEMTRMIRAQRAFSLASRALTTADDMEGIANNMRR